MVLLESFGLATNELFNYNRQNFTFDQMQRLKKDMARLDMQIERFTLFREDIDDLVKLTVDKMDMYHLVGALFLGFTLLMYTEGRPAEETPPYFLAIYFLSVAGSWIYLLMAVWLAMYASISSHSFGVRLRTRYVRMPIPSFSEINAMTTKLSEVERSGLGKLMRIPFTGRQEWAAGRLQPSAAASSNACAAEASTEHGEAGFGRAKVVLNAAATVQGKHVQMFRRLQSRWQCYDAYARVCMSLGVNQGLMAVNYFVISLCTIEWQMHPAGFALTAIFQSSAAGILFLDIAGLRGYQIFLFQMLGAMPPTIALLSSTVWKSWQRFHAWSVAFLLEACWMEVMLWVARPSGRSMLPRRYRSVLFVDVFGDAEYDPTEAEHKVAPVVSRRRARDGRKPTACLAMAEQANDTALAALRRWEAVPEGFLSEVQLDQLHRLRRELNECNRLIESEHMERIHGGVDEIAQGGDASRPWDELTKLEKQESPFAGQLLGPLERFSTKDTYYYNLEETRCVGRQELQRLLGGREPPVLRLEEVQRHVSDTQNLTDLMFSEDEATRSDSGDSQDSGSSTETNDRSSAASSDSDASIALGPGQTSKRRERLPWFLLRNVTRVLEVCWVFLGVVQLLVDLEVHHFPMMPPATCRATESERRLLEVERIEVQPVEQQRLHFRQLKVAWPYGAFFQPESLECIPAAAGLTKAPSGLLVGSRYATHRAQLGGKEELNMHMLPRASFPRGVVALCGGPARGREGFDGCIFGVSLTPGVSVWAPGHRERHQMLAIDGPAWMLFAGVQVRCRDATLLVAPEAPPATEWCLLLAGWTGKKLPVALVPLPARFGELPVPATALELGSFRVQPILDVPVPATEVVQALYLEPREHKLLVLLESHELQVWDLLLATGLQISLTLELPEAVGCSFSPAALCVEDREHRLLVIGFGSAAGPELLESAIRFPEVLMAANATQVGPVL